MEPRKRGSGKLSGKIRKRKEEGQESTQPMREGYNDKTSWSGPFSI